MDNLTEENLKELASTVIRLEHKIESFKETFLLNSGWEKVEQPLWDSKSWVKRDSDDNYHYKLGVAFDRELIAKRWNPFELVVNGGLHE